MSYIQNVYPIQSRDAIARDVFDYVVACPDIASQSHAGQFVHIRVAGHTLRRPISICEAVSYTHLYQALGAGHLPDGTGRAILPADLPECPVAHPCHRRQNRGPGQYDVPDLQIPVSPLPWTG